MQHLPCAITPPVERGTPHAPHLSPSDRHRPGLCRNACHGLPYPGYAGAAPNFTLHNNFVPGRCRSGSGPMAGMTARRRSRCRPARPRAPTPRRARCASRDRTDRSPTPAWSRATRSPAGSPGRAAPTPGRPAASRASPRPFQNRQRRPREDGHQVRPRGFPAVRCHFIQRRDGARGQQDPPRPGVGRLGPCIGR